MNFPIQYFIAVGLISLLGLFAPARSIGAPSCESIFLPTPVRKMREARSRDFPSGRNFYRRAETVSGLDRLDKNQVETLFLLRDRIMANSPRPIELESSAEVLLVEQILDGKLPPKEGWTQSSFESRLAVPAFQRLAYLAALRQAARSRAISNEELLQASMIGLIHAIRSFKADSRYLFSTAMFRHARYHMDLLATGTSPGMDLATDAKAYRYLVTFLAIRDQLRAKTESEPSSREIASAFNKAKLARSGRTMVSPPQVQNAIARYEVARQMAYGLGEGMHTLRGLHHQQQESNRDADLDESLMSSDSGPELSFSRKQGAARLAEMMIKKLSARERLVLSLHFGLFPVKEASGYSVSHAEPMTQEYIAAHMGVSQAYVHQVERKALARLKFRNPDLSNIFEDIRRDE